MAGSSGLGAASSSASGLGLAGGHSSKQDEVDLKDFIQLTMADKSSGSGVKGHQDHLGRHCFGLLEVEPLHFTCHATSDGTRVEKMDIGED